MRLCIIGISHNKELAVVTKGETVKREKDITGAIFTTCCSKPFPSSNLEYASHFGKTRMFAASQLPQTRHCQALHPLKAYTSVVKGSDQADRHIFYLNGIDWIVHGVMNTD